MLGRPHRFPHLTQAHRAKGLARFSGVAGMSARWTERTTSVPGAPAQPDYSVLTGPTLTEKRSYHESTKADLADIACDPGKHPIAGGFKPSGNFSESSLES